MKLNAYRESEAEQERIQNLFNLINDGECALDIGARDGYLSIRLTNHFSNVTALDLVLPRINNPRITCVQGNICSLPFHNRSFDLVLCTEVLEHIPTHLLTQACNEISRVSRKHILIGVPYDQDIRLGRSTCYTCGKKNPPWGHINSFKTDSLTSLFPRLFVEQVSFVGKRGGKTNILSTLLMDLAGNPYGSYTQDECCIYCDSKLKVPPKRNLLQKIATRSAVTLNKIQAQFTTYSANWIHILFSKEDSRSDRSPL